MEYDALMEARCCERLAFLLELTVLDRASASCRQRIKRNILKSLSRDLQSRTTGSSIRGRLMRDVCLMTAAWLCLWTMIALTDTYAPPTGGLLMRRRDKEACALEGADE